jgi:alpha-aminoadipate carrier protein LysW
MVGEVPTVRCPICGQPVELPEDLLPGEVIEHDCGVVLEAVVENGSISLRPLEGVSEDWGE